MSVESSNDSQVEQPEEVLAGWRYACPPDGPEVFHVAVARDGNYWARCNPQRTFLAFIEPASPVHPNCRCPRRACQAKWPEYTGSLPVLR